MTTRNSSINLLKNKEIGFFDKFINWVLTIGRLVVIVTELVALSAFLYRFSLDRRLIDLRGNIKQEQTVVRFLSTNEDKYRNLQERLGLISDFSNLNKDKVKLFGDIIGFTTKGVTFNNFTLYRDRISIVADTQSTASLTSFVNALKTYPSVDTISIDKIENKPTSALITVSITVLLKKEKI